MIDFVTRLVLKQIRHYLKKVLKDHLEVGQEFTLGAEWLPDITFQGYTLDVGLAVKVTAAPSAARAAVRPTPFDPIDISTLQV